MGSSKHEYIVELLRRAPEFSSVVLCRNVGKEHWRIYFIFVTFFFF